MKYMKTCSKCKIKKSDKQFYKDKRNKDGLTSNCKLCQIEISKAWVKRNRPAKGVWKHRLSNIDKVSRTANCSFCGKVKLKKTGTGFTCYKAHKARERLKILERSGLIVEFDVLKCLTPPPGKCPICKQHTDKFVFDHDHKTGKFRGWICHTCNIGLGMFRDNVLSLKSAIKYLNKNIG